MGEVVFIVFYSVLHPFHEYFISYETGQSLGRAIMGETENPPGNSKAELGLFHMCPVWARNHTRNNGDKDKLSQEFLNTACVALKVSWRNEILENYSGGVPFFTSYSMYYQCSMGSKCVFFKHTSGHLQVQTSHLLILCWKYS